jgi:hypothetical protein
MSELGVIICPHIFLKTHPVLFVFHEDDGGWQFLCGAGHEESDKPKLVGINHLFEQDATLNELQSLPQGWRAERMTTSDPWIKRPIEDDERG